MTDQQHAAHGPERGPGTGPGGGAPGAGPGPGGGASGGFGGPGSASAPPPPGSGGQEPGGTAPGAPGREPGRGAVRMLDGLRRSREQKLLGGVCGGLGRHCEMDPVIFRVVLAVLSLTAGLGLILYGFGWLFVPADGEEENEARRLLSGRVDGRALTAVLCTLVGCGLFLSMLGNEGVLTFGAIVALLLAGAGYWSQQRGAPDPDPLAAQAAADAPPEAKAPPAPSSFPSWWRDPIVKDGTHVGGTGYLWGPRDMRDMAPARKVATSSRWDDEARPARAPAAGGRTWIGGWLFLLALLAAAVGTALTWDTRPLGTSLQTGLAGALAVYGVGIGVSALLGRTGAGSIMLAVIVAALLAGASALPKNITTQWIHATWRPPTAAVVHPHYELGSGEGTLDLRHVDAPRGGPVRTGAEIGAGRLLVLIPADATVRLHVEVGLGDIQLPGDGQQDVDVAPGKEKTVTLYPAAGHPHGDAFDLDLKVGVGQVEVDRAAS